MGTPLDRKNRVDGANLCFDFKDIKAVFMAHVEQFYPEYIQQKVRFQLQFYPGHPDPEKTVQVLIYIVQ